MMMSPQWYYDEYLKGKTAAQIMTAIRSLKREMGRLKNIMEHPDYGTQEVMCPGEDVQLQYVRMYLEKAKEALAEAGGTYVPSQAEQKAVAFDEGVPFITKMELTIGSFGSGQQVRSVAITEGLLDKLRELHLGEWRRHYDPMRFGIVILDGISWRLYIEYSDGRKPVTISGDNAYPYNFEELAACFDLDRYDEEGDFL